jgi:hypothetical protein
VREVTKASGHTKIRGLLKGQRAIKKVLPQDDKLAHSCGHING